MESIKQVSERIVKSIRESNQPEDVLINAVEFNIECLLSDIMKLIKNINDTSLNAEDKNIRFAQLEEKCGYISLRSYFL